MILLLFIIGLFFGSFLNVLVDRIPQGKTVVKGRSRCDFCRKKLNWYDLVPVFSFVFSKGKCRYCKRSLSIFYPVIEVTTGLMFVLTYLFTIYYLPFTNSNEIINHQSSIINLLYYLLIISSFIVIFFTDLKYGIIPDKVLLLATMIVAFYLLFISPELSIINLISGVATFLFFIIISLGFSLLLKKESMGGGDIKLVFLLGLFLGFPNIIISLYIAFLTGAAVGIILILWRKKSFRKATIPFGPFLILGAILSLFWGNPIYAYALKLLGY
jgi:leader peptidase (prepilin peptidase)/N-methyltransferase